MPRTSRDQREWRKNSLPSVTTGDFSHVEWSRTTDCLSSRWFMLPVACTFLLCLPVACALALVLPVACAFLLCLPVACALALVLLVACAFLLCLPVALALVLSAIWDSFIAIVLISHTHKPGLPHHAAVCTLTQAPQASST